MGNVNGREDLNGSSPSGAEDEEEERGFDSVGDCMSLPDGVLHPAPPSELMGHSPPASPRATQSPLMFTPQVSSFIFYLLHLFPIHGQMGFVNFHPDCEKFAF